eukprot:c8172_g1_i2.p1 GENE.c8172_g1_i2~~c8172_g1_i2.p1  ORF type:complete len:673 (+),score=132.56 c8172_g1_i2:48-2066(+)
MDQHPPSSTSQHDQHKVKINPIVKFTNQLVTFLSPRGPQRSASVPENKIYSPSHQHNQNPPSSINKMGHSAQFHSFFSPVTTTNLTIESEDEWTKIFHAIAGSDKVIDFHEWEKLCSDLHFNLSQKELERVFNSLDEDGSGFLDLHEYLRGMRQFQFLKSVVTAYANLGSTEFETPAGYKFDKETSYNYRLDDRNAFYGEFQDVRRARDFAYHGNYTRERQLWQDSVIKSIVMRSEPRASPWVLYTCGPMGAGKGYALSWMSANGYLPLEHIVHVDPDHFKELMPEWKLYQKHSPNKEEIGTMCHKESCYLAEIAQEVAMRNRQHIWVDGSLRDGAWYGKVFDDIRKRYPNYYIAIFYVFASESVVRARIRSRAEKTGRSVPEYLIQQSLAAPDHSLGVLTSKVDFVARIRNEGKVPELVAYEVVDRSGQFGLIREQFARHDPPPNRFPSSLAPLTLIPTKLTSADIIFPKNHLHEHEHDLVEWFISDNLLTSSAALKSFESISTNRTGTLSPVHAVNVGTKARAELQIPESAISFGWMSPLKEFEKVRELVDLHDPIGMLLLHGGFAYFDLEDRLVQINAIFGFVVHTPQEQACTATIQFGPPITLSPEVVTALEHRFHPVTWQIQNAQRLRCAWIRPRERVDGTALTAYGGFAFVSEEEGWAYCYPVTSS